MMSGDLIARAKAAHAMVRPDGTWAVRGCTEMYAVLPELVAKVERLQALHDALEPVSSALDMARRERDTAWSELRRVGAACEELVRKFNAGDAS